MDAKPRLLTKAQLAEWMQVTPRTVDRWTAENRFPDGMRVVVAGTPRFREDIAAEWIAACCPRACDDPRDIREEAGYAYCMRCEKWKNAWPTRQNDGC